MAEPGPNPNPTAISIRRVGPFPRVSPPVFITAALSVLVFVLFGSLFTEPAETLFNAIQGGITRYLGWYYILVTSLFVGFVLWLLLSRYGDVRLGDPHEKPEYGYFSWFAMLFSAGMGIGLLFWSIAEPMYHYVTPPFGAEGESARAAEVALRTTFFHWGLHAWAIYVIVGLSLAYFAYRHKLPLSIRSAFYPLFGDRIYGWPGHVIDTIAVFGTLFGVATSLGLGVQQVNAGLAYLLDIPQSLPIQLGLIAVITAIATASVVAGLNKGVKFLSELNIWLSLGLVTLILVLGPTIFILNTFVETTGRYLQNLVLMSFWTDTIGNSGWAGSWTIFYWGWWIAWAPFVGMFIARVSRGRTIREFTLGVLFVPTLVTFLWLSVFGGTALNLELLHDGGIAAAVQADLTTALYVTLDQLPLAGLTAAVATVVVVTFFVTSSDSGSLVIDMLTSGGELDPPRVQRVFWAVLEGVVAAVLLVAGGLGALQTASIATGLLFSVVMVLMCVSLLKAFRHEPITPTVREREADAPKETFGDIEHPREG
ncbi:BCCT family transporter [Flagellatimonas centrodinii]|uniref:glycine betaine uptake BCCT transporter n=1 Tax=Flagellatimonas centrodinii TaxID=2806210 RepID=UPI001FEF872B|nr:BCCT family transporter [Flagellatimonas centrodinii]ULQ47049.1 BCCT family transporter [Flagellatimonas centrodinii]